MNRSVYYVALSVACVGGLLRIEVAGAQTTIKRPQVVSTARPAVTARPTATAQTRPPSTSTAAPVEPPCADTTGEFCFDARHDFMISVPVRPELAGARSNVATLEQQVKDLEAAIAAAEQRLPGLEAKQKDAERIEAELRGKAGSEKDYAVAKAALDSLIAEIAKLKNALPKQKTDLAALNATLATARQAVTDLSKPADIRLSGTTFLLAGVLKLDRVGDEFSRACDTPASFQTAINGRMLKVFPEQPWVVCNALTILPGEIITDQTGSTPRSLPTHTFDVNKVGTWQQIVDVTHAKAWSTVMIGTYARSADGALTISGYVQSSGRTPGINSHQALAFSAASLKISGGADVPRVVVDWGPSLTTQTGGDSSRAYDPVSIHLFDPAGKERRREQLLDVFMSTKGAGAMHWRGDGQLSVDSDEAVLNVRMPSSLARDKGEIKFAVKGGAVSQRSATGVLAAHRLPALGARTRATTTATVAPARLPGVAPKSSKMMKFDIAVPKLAKKERFEIRLGGGGAQTARKP